MGKCWKRVWKGCMVSDFNYWTLHKRQTRSRLIRMVSEGEKKSDINSRRQTSWRSGTILHETVMEGPFIDLLKSIEHSSEPQSTDFHATSTSHSLLLFTTPQGVNIYLKCSVTGMSTDSWKLKVSCSDTGNHEAAGGSSSAWSKTSPGALFFLRTVGEPTSNTRGCAPGHTSRRPRLPLPWVCSFNLPEVFSS